jgi:diacylglycerol kinase
MNEKKFSIRKRLRSFKYAINGLSILLREEHNARIHFFASCCVIFAGFFFRISALEWMAITFAIGFVFSMEIMNSAIENMADFISPEKHLKIKRIKDLSAAGVLVSALAALFIGLIIFIPKLITFL